MELFFFSAMVYQLYYLHQLIGFFFLPTMNCTIMEQLKLTNIKISL